MGRSLFHPCFNNRRVPSPLPMFCHLREYLFKAAKTASKKKRKKNTQENLPHFRKTETWCDRVCSELQATLHP